MCDVAVDRRASSVSGSKNGLEATSEIVGHDAIDASTLSSGPRGDGKDTGGGAGSKESMGLPMLPAEVEEGNCEYKWSLAHLNDPARVGKLTSQLKWRLQEGGGTMTYLLGVEDCGKQTGISKQDMRVSLQVVRGMAKSLNCSVEQVEFSQGLTKHSKTARVTIKKNASNTVPEETRVIMIGESGAGKTTLTSLLLGNHSDNGRGSARIGVLQHQHELESGNTMSVSEHRIRYAHDGTANVSEAAGTVPTGIFTDHDDDGAGFLGSAKVVNIIDAAGDPRYIKTTFYSLSALEPDHALVVVEANLLVALDAMDGKDCTAHLENHLSVTLNMIRVLQAYRTTFTIVANKVDLLPQHENTYTSNIANGAHKLVNLVTGRDCDLYRGAVACSCVSRQGVLSVRTLLGTVPRRSCHAASSAGIWMSIRKAFYTSGFEGVIIGGIVNGGVIVLGDTMKLGPDSTGRFRTVRVKSIRTAYGLDVAQAAPGQTVTIGVHLAPTLINTNCSDSDTDTLGDSEEEDGLFGGLTALGDNSSPLRHNCSLPPRNEIPGNAQQDLLRAVAQRGSYLIAVDCALDFKPTVRVEVLEWLSFSSRKFKADQKESNEEFGRNHRLIVRSRVAKCTVQSVHIEGSVAEVALNGNIGAVPGMILSLRNGTSFGVAKVL
mmetsp:Transcript_20125/g.37409  ORF Transcript_20125/g.37409 Transcript_20125/m.37409 type:complete len:660 (+) Transcript_20125:187-2166(+)